MYSVGFQLSSCIISTVGLLAYIKLSLLDSKHNFCTIFSNTTESHITDTTYVLYIPVFVLAFLYILNMLSFKYTFYRRSIHSGGLSGVLVCTVHTVSIYSDYESTVQIRFILL